MFLPAATARRRPIAARRPPATSTPRSKQLLGAAYADAKSILTEHRDKLELVAQELIKQETLDGVTFRDLLGMPSLPVVGEK